MQVRDSRPVQGFSIIQLLDATASDETRQDKTPFAVVLAAKVLYQTAKGEERSGGEWEGVVGRDEVRFR